MGAIAADPGVGTVYLVEPWFGVLVVFLFPVFRVRRSPFYRPLLALIQLSILVPLIDLVRSGIVWSEMIWIVIVPATNNPLGSGRSLFSGDD